VKFLAVVCEEAVGLVSSVVLGSHAPVNVGEYGLFFEVYCSEDSAAYFGSPQSRNKESRYLSVFMTFLTKNYGLRFPNMSQEIFAPCLQWSYHPIHFSHNPYFSVRLELDFTHLDLCIQFIGAFKRNIEA